MKLTKAIEILTLMGTPDFHGHTEDILAARKLGIEALKFLSTCKLDCPLYIKNPLPGETPENAPTRSPHHIKEPQKLKKGEK